MKNIKKILFYADGATTEGDALKRAAEIVRDLGASLHVIDVVADVSTTDTNPAVRKAIESLQQTLIDERLQVLEGLWNECGLDADVSVEVLAGTDYVELIRQVVEENYDLILKAANKPTLISRAIFGESDLRLLRKCPCPVWILKPSGRKKLEKILAAVDPLDINHKDFNKKIIEYASHLAAQENSELTIMGCWKMPFDISLETRIDQEKLELIEAGITNQCQTNLEVLTRKLPNKSFTLRLLKGPPEDLISEAVISDRIDLVVMGTLGRTGIPGLVIGNTAEKIIHNIKSSVLALKPDGFVYPSV